MADAVTVITNDHRVIEGIFDQLRSGQGDRMALLDEAGIRLEAHSRAEEDHVYPAIIRSDPDESKDVYHGYEEHHEAVALLYALKQMDPTDPRFDSMLNEFIEAVLHHVREEEAEILPALAQSVSQARLKELGVEFERRRKLELAARGMNVDEVLTGELRAEALAAQVPDRARMTLDELYESVRGFER